MDNVGKIKEVLEYLDSLNTRKFHYGKMLKKNRPDLYSFVMEQTGFLPEDSLFCERLFCLKSGITERVLCKTCGKNPVKFDSVNERYRDFCSTRCSTLSKDTQKKRRKTSIEKYGVDHAMKKSEIVERVKKTNTERYGVDVPMKNKDIVAKARSTNIKRYGVPSFAMTSEYVEKNRRTCLERYGVEWSFQSRNNIEKSRETCLEKYGVPSFSKTTRFKDFISNRRAENFLGKLEKFPVELVSVKSEFSSDKVLRWRCKECGEEFDGKVDFNYPLYVRCPKCHPKQEYSSDMENEVAQYVSSVLPSGIEVERNNRSIISPRELDIYVPSLKIGIEFDGLFWHSDRGRDDDLSAETRHLKKTTEAMEHGIHLIHIFEDEWLYKKRIVKARLKSILGCVRYRIYARKCEVREIGVQEKQKFLDKYHVQGGDKSSVRLGLFQGSRLVAVMTFSKARFTDKCEWELSRYATVANFTIVGGAGKLLSYFERKFKPKSIVSYADRRWSTGNVYGKLGFTLDHTSPPNYWYVKTFVRENRMKFQKHRLGSILEKFDENLSESDNMRINGYWKIFDCGNLVYVKQY